MKGLAGINLGNVISGAVVPALNISISLSLPACLAGWSWGLAYGGQPPLDGARGAGVQRQNTRFTNRLVPQP
jgi:hypothetical protein